MKDTQHLTAVVTPGWRGGSDLAIEIPDFKPVPGWDDAWAPEKTSTTDWLLSAYGWSGLDCTEGAREVTTITTGTVG